MSVNLWEGFLPAKALVMGKARQKMPGAGTEIPNETEAAAEAETESETVGFTVEGGGKSETLSALLLNFKGARGVNFLVGVRRLCLGKGIRTPSWFLSAKVRANKKIFKGGLLWVRPGSYLIA